MEGPVQTWAGETLLPLQTHSVSPQVIQGCGNPKVNPHGSGPEEKRRRGKLALQEKAPTGTLEKLVSSTVSVAVALYM